MTICTVSKKNVKQPSHVDLEIEAHAAVERKRERASEDEGEVAQRLNVSPHRPSFHSRARRVIETPTRLKAASSNANFSLTFDFEIIFVSNNEEMRCDPNAVGWNER